MGRETPRVLALLQIQLDRVCMRRVPADLDFIATQRLAVNRDEHLKDARELGEFPDREFQIESIRTGVLELKRPGLLDGTGVLVDLARRRQVPHWMPRAILND